MNGGRATSRRVLTAAVIAAVLVSLIYVQFHPAIYVKTRYTFVKSDSVLYDAIAGGASIETVKAIVQKNPGLARTYRFYGQSPLILAAERQRSDLVSLFLEMGADVNEEVEDESGKKTTTTLHIAATNDDVKTIEILLKYNPNTGLLDKYGRTAFDTAVGFDNKAAADLLRKKQQLREEQKSKRE